MQGLGVYDAKIHGACVELTCPLDMPGEGRRAFCLPDSSKGGSADQSTEGKGRSQRWGGRGLRGRRRAWIEAGTATEAPAEGQQERQQSSKAKKGARPERERASHPARPPSPLPGTKGQFECGPRYFKHQRFFPWQALCTQHKLSFL